MTMHNNGISKLIEELSELIVDLAKKQAFPTGKHPDGRGDINERIQNGMADVEAAIEFVRENLGYWKSDYEARRRAKLEQFRKWHSDPNV